MVGGFKKFRGWTKSFKEVPIFVGEGRLNILFFLQELYRGVSVKKQARHGRMRQRAYQLLCLAQIETYRCIYKNVFSICFFLFFIPLFNILFYC